MIVLMYIDIVSIYIDTIILSVYIELVNSIIMSIYTLLYLHYHSVNIR